MTTCPACGADGPPGALHCASCGAPFASDGPPGAGPDPLLGATLKGTYLIQQKLGSGGMGDVYRAVHLKLDAPVAVKIIRRDLLGHPAMIHRFEREARAASRLRHPNVVSVTDFGQTEDGTLFMVMEYVAGISLARVIAAEAPLPERRVVHVGAQILTALAEAHANGILHRDLKPENVLLESRRDAPDAVKVLDFGVAKLLAVGEGASTLTQAGLVCGTPGYMSPEQLRGGEVDGRSDLFSVGVVLYEMLTRKLPFDVETPMEMLHRHLSEPIPPPSQRRARPVSPALEAVVMQALAPAREGRPPDAEAMRARLLAAVAALPAEAEAGEDVLATEVLRAGDAPEPVASAVRTPGSRPRGTPPRAPTAARSGVGPGTRTPAAGRASPTVDAAVLERLEGHLLPLLGPVAPHVVRRASREAPSLEQLCAHLATFLRSADDRKRFLAWAGAELHLAAGPRRATPTPLPVKTPAAAWDPAVLDRARRDLAVHLGPLARIIVRRVCTRARDVRELYQLLALEIPSEPERELFRRQAPEATSGGPEP